MNKKEFVNVFCNPYTKKAAKITSLFKITVDKQRISEGQYVKVYMTISCKEYHILQEMLTKSDFNKVLKGISITAKSTLSEKDTWDEQKGLDLAEHKALAKAYNKIVNMIENKQVELAKQQKSLMYIRGKFAEKRDKQFNCFEKIGEVK